MSEDFASIDDVHVTLNDLRQDLRGKFINLIGNANSQDKTKQSTIICSLSLPPFKIIFRIYLIVVILPSQFLRKKFSIWLLKNS